jgi:hypothetical protein
MVTATLVLMSVLLVVLAGEAVRGQCRRMLSHPATSVEPMNGAIAATVSGPVGQELAA